MDVRKNALLLYVACFISLLFLSCGKNDKIQQQLNDMYGMKLNVCMDNYVLMHNPLCDSIGYVGSNCLKLVCYIDSSSCTSCSLKALAGWNKYIIFEKKKQMRCIFCVEQNSMTLKELADVHKESHLLHDVYVDTCGEFRRLNPKIPNEQMFHTLLLDEHNKIIFVGDPIMNKNIEPLFVRVLNDKLKNKHS